jgi:hypothetical protein
MRRKKGADGHDVQLIPTPVGWGLYCKPCKWRTGPFTKKPEAEAAAEAHRATPPRR